MPNKSPRLQVTVTEEQHGLLTELGKLQGRSAASFLREQLDVSTPLLRAAVPLLRQAAREMSTTKAEAMRLLEEPMRLMREMGLDKQMDLLDDGATVSNDERNAASASKRGREEADTALPTSEHDDA